MTRTCRARRWTTLGVGFALMLSLAACGGNVGGSNQPATADEFPNGPISMLIGQDPGGSTDLIGRALADEVTKDLGVPITVENRPGANGALAARELANAAPDGQTIMVLVGSLAYITPLAVSPDEAIDLNNYEVVTGLSQDDYVLVASPSSGFRTVQDMVAAGRPINFGTTDVGTGSQLSSELLFKQAGVSATAVPFDGGAPTLTAVLGNQVDVASIQLGEAISQIKADAVASPYHLSSRCSHVRLTTNSRAGFQRLASHRGVRRMAGLALRSPVSSARGIVLFQSRSALAH